MVAGDVGFVDVLKGADGAADVIGPMGAADLGVQREDLALAGLDEEEILLGLSGELDPAVIKPASDRQFLAVVMPMRI